MSDSTETLTQYLDSWTRDQSQQNIIITLSKISDLIEKETELYLKMDPDPFDDRHPSRSKPSCSLGYLLKSLFKNDDFMNELVTNYLMNRDCKELQILSCRLAIDILPGLEISVVFNDTDGLLDRLFAWAREDDEPLQSYATGLLAAAMELQDIAAHNREKNAELVPIMLKKLKFLMEERKKLNHDIEMDSGCYSENLESATKRRRISSPSNDCSNSSWAEMETYLIGSFKIYPLTNEISQRFIFQYLSSMGEYQELLSYIFEHNVLSMILEAIDLNKNHDVRLAFESLKYLSSLICHKKFTLEFVNNGGIQALLKVYKQSFAASGVSLCLNCISSHDDVMEKICMLPSNILNELISYALFLIERSHDSSRTNAMIFFSLGFLYKEILELFDNQDGLRKILNEISMIDLFSTHTIYTEDEIFTKRQYAKHICFALRRYFETHLILKAQALIQTTSKNFNSDHYSNYARLININFPPYKPINYDNELIMEHVEALLHLVPVRCQWEPVDKLIKYGGAKLLIQYISISYDWNFNGKADAIRSALDILVVCSVMPKFQQILIESINIDDGPPVVGMRIVLAAAAGEIVSDPECQKSALNVIINCVCGPINRISGLNMTRMAMGSTKRKLLRCGEDILNKLWNCVRFNNGIMLLINLLVTKTPITDADSIRTLSCKALCGLARSENVRQVICKLPLFTNGQIQTLMKEPILQDKRNEHLKFCKYCIELIERITGSPVTDSLETSLGNLNKTEVITQTKIIFNEKELLKLIHNHLNEKGLTKTAQMLAEEADLSDSSINSQVKNALKFSTPPKTFSPRMSRQISAVTSTCYSSPFMKSSSSNNNYNDIFETSTNTGIPIRINRANRNKINNSNNTNFVNNSRRHSFHSNIPIGKKEKNVSSSSQQHQPSSIISLDSIVIEYLRKQHALCKNPVITCPPFDLFKPHRCPEPKKRNVAPFNITSRLVRKQYYPPYGGFYGSKMDRKYIYSRFRSCRSLRCFEQTIFLNCAFAHNANLLFVGSENGELHVFNYQTGDIENTFTCYDSLIMHIEPSQDNKHILTTTFWDQPNSILWYMNDTNFEEKMTFPNDNHVEFGKSSQDKVLGTQDYTAHLYDLNVSRLVRTFEDENYSNKYLHNIATFHPDDYVILNDGVLWDVRAETPLHKFDKFNQTINGIFHPSGQEIISSSEIWDIKTYKLLKTVTALSQSHIKFNNKGDVIYAVYEEEEKQMNIDDKITYTSSFRTFDGYDYSQIATIDVKRSINALAVDPNDKYIAVIESVRESNSYYTQDNIVRIYEVGRCREEDDERADEDDDAENEESDDEESFNDERFDEDESSYDTPSFLTGSDSDSELDDDDSDNSDFEADSGTSTNDDDDDGIFYQLND